MHLFPIGKSAADVIFRVVELVRHGRRIKVSVTGGKYPKQVKIDLYELAAGIRHKTIYKCI